MLLTWLMLLDIEVIWLVSAVTPDWSVLTEPVSEVTAVLIVWRLLVMVSNDACIALNCVVSLLGRVVVEVTVAVDTAVVTVVVMVFVTVTVCPLPPPDPA
jgi:hypothetical protein